MNRIGILNYGTGNLFSVFKSFSEIGESPLVVSIQADLHKVDALVLPGVGHFGSAMRYLIASALLPDVRAMIRAGLPTLGICLGFQLLCEYSEEDLTTKGLGLLPLGVSRLNSRRKANVKVPHIGWNSVSPGKGHSILFEGLAEGRRFFYFANSFGVQANETVSVSTTYFHGDHYLASVESSSMFGVQFHPEKSGEQGLHVLKNFTKVIR
jgi:glutamine amidotransferase